MREIIYKHALKNALEYGKAEQKAVLGKVLAEQPELKARVREVIPLIQSVVKEVNALPKQKLAEEIKKFEFAEKKEVKKEALPELKPETNVVMRFAPNPSGPLHLGHCRAAILNDEYVKRYGGKFILRLEDTDPARVDPQAYDMILHDLEWLGVSVHEVAIQSERLDIYAEHARKLIETGAAYVCVCSQEEFQKMRNAGRACKCRSSEIGENLRRFEKMFREYKQGEAVVRVKTALDLPDLSARDFVILRITEEPHPRITGKRVYPLYNFSVVVDDHLMKVTHVLRGKDHIANTQKQLFIYRYFDWTAPEFIHYGLLKIEGVELSTSLMGKGIKEGTLSGWDDARLGTLRTMRRRGIQPGAIRRAMLDVGTKDTDISFSWKNLYAYNRELIEARANRYFFVAEPRELVVKNCPAKKVSMPLHPDYPERGRRSAEIKVKNGTAKFFIAKSDFEALKPNEVVRLMDAFNLRILRKGEALEAEFYSEALDDARALKAKLIHWVPFEENVKVKVVAPEATHEGFGEVNLKNLKVEDMVQFERFGFVRIDSVAGDSVVAYFAHK